MSRLITENDFYVRSEKENNKIYINSVNLTDSYGNDHLNKNLRIEFFIDNVFRYKMYGVFLDPNNLHWAEIYEYSNQINDLQLKFYDEKEFLFEMQIDKLGNHFYNKIDGWFDFQKVYKQAVENGRDGDHFVEIGSWLGRSASFMATEIKYSKKNIKFDAVDTWKGSNEIYHELYIEKHGSVYDNFLKNIEPVNQYITPIREHSQMAPNRYEDRSLDFVFIDADHSYDEVKKDIECWYPKVKLGGIIAGHDYYNSYQVQRAVKNTIGENIKTNRLSWIHEKINIEIPMK